MQELTQARLKELLHYDPETGAFIRLKTPKKSLVGKQAQISDGRYFRVKIGSKRYRAHRLAWFYMTGQWPLELIDHINGDGFDNRWVNLREATTFQNAANRAPNAGKSTKGIRKVDYGYMAYIGVNNRLLYLGYFKSETAAQEAYNQAALKHFGEFVRV